MDLGTLQHRLGKRGFRLVISMPLECPKCKAQALGQYTIFGKTGGRDIELCHDCLFSRSYRTDPSHNDRVLDESFDMEKFLAK